jgi:hypothetical protein
MTAAAVFALPGLWAGLTFAVACVAASVWLRPRGGPF